MEIFGQFLLPNLVRTNCVCNFPPSVLMNTIILVQWPEGLLESVQFDFPAWLVLGWNKAVKEWFQWGPPQSINPWRDNLSRTSPRHIPAMPTTRSMASQYFNERHSECWTTGGGGSTPKAAPSFGSVDPGCQHPEMNFLISCAHCMDEYMVSQLQNRIN